MFEHKNDHLCYTVFVELVVMILFVFVGNGGSSCSMMFSNPFKVVHGAILSHTAGSAFRMDRRTSDKGKVEVFKFRGVR